ncbi:MAG: ABC transporter permease, partial [Bacteroidota bacterium]
MFYNSLKLAWRNLLKSKYTSAINLLGLTVGMTAALLIWHFVAFEKSYDKFHEHEASIVRVKTDRVKDGEVFMEFAAGATAAGPFMQQYFPEVDTFVKMNVFGEGIFRHKDQVFRETKAYFVSNGLFEVFSIPLIKGNSNTCLEGPRKALITESTAKKFFGDSEPMGQRIQRNGEDEFEITGVIKDWPENSHLKPQILMSYATYQGYMGNTPDLETAMYWDGFLTYLKLQPNVNINELQDKIPAKMGEVYDQDVREDVVFVLQKLEDIHLFSNHLFEAEANGDGHAVQYLFFIGCLVLLIAWFNYVNLATARSETRAREVGVRKVIGSGRGDLIRQFLLEAALLNIVAIISSIVLAQLLSPTFDQLAGKEIPTRLLDNPSLLSAVVLVFLGGTVLTGLYPAFILSGYKPATALSGMVGKGSNGSLMRKSLVVIQFAVSVILIAGTIIIFQQLMHLQKTKLGVNIEQTVVVNAPMVFDSTYQAKYAAFKKEVTRIAGVQQITGSTDVPGQQVGWTAAIRIWGADDNSFEGLQAIAMDADFGEQFGLEAVAGRLLSPDMLSDSAACLLNERGVERLRIESPEAAVGMDVDFWGDRLKIVGVVKNFHQRSPKMEFEPLILRLSDPESPPAY